MWWLPVDHVDQVELALPQRMTPRIQRPTHALCIRACLELSPPKRLWSAPPPSPLITQRELARAGYRRGERKASTATAVGIEARAKKLLGGEAWLENC